MKATFTKLKTGEWGVRVEGTPTVGQEISVTKKSGEVSTVLVSKVVWEGTNPEGHALSLCEIEAKQSTQPNRTYYRKYASNRKTCPMCGSRECSRAWNPRDLCDED